jgi:hypothetical protein
MVRTIWKRLNVPENAGFFHWIFFSSDERDSTFQLLQIIAAYLFIKIHQYLMPAPIIERQSEGVS